MSFDPFHACLYTEKMAELKEAVVQENYANTPGIVQNSNKKAYIGIGIAAAACLILGGVYLADENNFAQDAQADRDFKLELLGKAAQKLGMSTKDLTKLVEETVNANPDAFLGGHYKDPDSSTVQDFVRWWNSPSSREIKAKMNVRFIPALRAAVKQHLDVQRDQIARQARNDPNPYRVTEKDPLRGDPSKEWLDNQARRESERNDKNRELDNLERGVGEITHNTLKQFSRNY